MEPCEESQFEVQHVRGQTRVVSARSIPPLKILNPANLSEAAMVFLSSYGGGMVQGDTVRLRITCGERTRVFIGSQANNRVFKHLDAQDTQQVIHATVEAQALVVAIPDPLVMHAECRFRQTQSWTLASDSSLVLADWIQSGRSDSGESFAYERWESDLRILIDGRIACIDRFKSEPGAEPPGSPSRFGDRALMLNLYLAGPVVDLLKPVLMPFTELKEIGQVRELSDQPGTPYPGLIVSMNPVEGAQVAILRALAHTREDFKPLLEVLHAALATTDWLGFDPQVRKY
ncbi:MAG: urease accessory protein [Kiritimatiellia bacterium]|jgi:urease accessory protein